MESKQIVERYYAAFAEHDLGKARALLTDDFTFKGPVMEASSADDMMAKLSAFGCDYESEVRGMIADGDRVAVNFTCTFRAPFQGVFDMCEWFTVRGGKIAASELFYDATNMPALDTLGG